jgi:hypothetical protein
MLAHEEAQDLVEKILGTLLAMSLCALRITTSKGFGKGYPVEPRADSFAGDPVCLKASVF